MSFTGSIEDRLAIRELLDCYADGVNQRDADCWGSTWAEQSVWKLPVVPGMENVTGKANIVAAWKSSMELFPFVFMAISVGHIAIDGDKATVRSYTSEVAKMQDGTELRPRGQYDDIVVKINGQWLFQERSFQSLFGE
jgi:ketosteroid isomerase-like protein